MANHDHERFEIFLYSDVLREDELTARIRGLADHWHSILGLSDANVADLIREHRIDIVVFIPPGNRLLVMARKPAPLLLTWLFSASSSGLGEIDYRVSDPFIDPVASDDSCYSERTLRLPQTAWCYDPLVDGASVSPRPAIQNGYVTFGSLVRLCKINRSVLGAWSAVLKSVAGSRLFLLAPGGVARQRVLDSFASFEIDPQRIQFVPRHSRSDYLQTYRDIDIVLDTFPYNGHTTTLDAMWMGVPAVTLAHRRPVGRVGTSLLTNVGLTELIAENPEQYVSTAMRLADDLAALAALRAGLRRRLEVPPLMDGRGFALNMESAYRRIWQDWCQSRTGATRSAPPTADRF